MNTIADEFQGFKEHSGMLELPEPSMQNIRRAYYAGAMGMYRLYNLIVNSELSDAAVGAMIDGLSDEMELFCEQAIKGEV